MPAAPRLDVGSAAGQDLFDQLLFLKTVARQAEHDMVQLVARLDDAGDFAEHGVRPAPALADLDEL